MNETGEEMVLQGQAASGGVAAGTLRVFPPGGDEADAAAPESGGAAFGAAVNRARDELSALIARENELAGEILEFQLALLDDEDFLAPVHAGIAAGVPWRKAWEDMIDAEIAEYRGGGDEYLAARAADLLDLKQRVAGTGLDLAGLKTNDILLTADLTPSQFLQLSGAGLAGIALTGGSPTGHVAILARDRDFNLITGLNADPADLPDAAPAVMDGSTGVLTIWPEKEILAAAVRKMVREHDERKKAEELAGRAARTADGEAVTVMINVADPGSLEGVSPDICDGIGLTRTEFLFSGGHLPDEDAQTAVYRRIAEWARGRPVVIRTLDAGGDKPVAGVTVDGESNPFLGLRGVRLSLRNPAFFRVQLRALLRAARFGDLRIMVPMVSAPEEMTQVRLQLARARDELRARGEAFGEAALGMMVEVPAAALTAEDFDTDFYSIGSNDLIQYTLAAARDNPALAGLAGENGKAVLKLIARTVAAGKALGREVCLCGAMASEPESVAALLDAGLRCLSVAPAMSGLIKLAVSRYSTARGEQD